jgi:hypothetical protein
VTPKLKLFEFRMTRYKYDVLKKYFMPLVFQIENMKFKDILEKYQGVHVSFEGNRFYNDDPCLYDVY